MNADPADRSFLSLLGVAAAATSTLCAFSSAFLHRHATTSSMSSAQRISGIVLIALVIVVVAIGIAAGLRELSLRWSATKRLEHGFARLKAPVPSEVTAVADKHHLADRLDWLDTSATVALTAGLWRPRVVVSRGLRDALTEPELDAVLAHEAYHVRRRDPLRALVAHCAAATFFYLPPLRRLQRTYETNAEVLADRRALRRLGPRPVAGALNHVVSTTGPGRAAIAAMGAPTALEARVQQLETGAPPPSPGPATWVAGGLVFVPMVLVLDGSLLLLGVRGEPGATLVDAAVHLAFFAVVWASFLIVPPPACRWIARHLTALTPITAPWH